MRFMPHPRLYCSVTARLVIAAVAALGLTAPASAQSTSAQLELELLVRHLDVPDLQGNSSSNIRRAMGPAVSDHFNDFLYSTTVALDPGQSITDTYDPVTDDTTLRFLVQKGGFVDWTDTEIDLILEMSTSPSFYLTIANELELNWFPPEVDPSALGAVSTVIFTPNDLFGLVASDVDLANREVMQLTVLSATQTDGSPIPEPTSLVLLGLGGMSLATRRRSV